MSSIAATTAIRTITIVIPAIPQIDKYWAILRQIFDLQEAGVRFQFAFCDKNVPDEADRAKWDNGVPGSAILVDVGSLKYHKGYRSASDFQMYHSDTHQSHIWNRGCALINLNSNTGFLKSYPHSIAHLVREIPHVFGDRERGQMETFQYGMKAVRAMFRPTNVRTWTDLFEKAEYADLRQLWLGFGVDDPTGLYLGSNLRDRLQSVINGMNEQYAHLNLKYDDVAGMLPWFTLPGYFYRLFVAGEKPAEIMRLMSWWLDHARQAKQRKEQASNKQYRFSRFSLSSGPQYIRGALVHVDNYFEAGAFTHKCVGNPGSAVAIAIVRTPTGGVLIQSSYRHQVDLERLYNELNRLEPGLWYYEKRFSDQRVQMIMNQSPQFVGVPPSRLTDRQLEAMVGMYAVYIQAY